MSIKAATLRNYFDYVSPFGISVSMRTVPFAIHLFFVTLRGKKLVVSISGLAEGVSVLVQNRSCHESL
jgi:hypothetical protein